ncbi:MAG TPA: plasmid pRiA4b ORF-3 family protein [Chloroflexi bacterium]|nr:plasmid pRiA4b ORF-3 family protein [Chloroflexota bacterium]
MTELPVYQIKITLADTHPPIWRRLLVTGDTPLDELHAILQLVMGWDDYHLHQFIVGETYYGEPHPEFDDYMEVKDESKVVLGQIVSQEGDQFGYEYDFGDSWLHIIQVEEVLEPDPELVYPLCIGGKRAGPPEDVGGVWGYAEFLEAIKDRNHPEHAEYMEWVGGGFDPEAFDPDEINDQLDLLYDMDDLLE